MRSSTSRLFFFSPAPVRTSGSSYAIAAFVVYLLHYQLLPEDRLAELMADRQPGQLQRFELPDS